MIFKSFYYCSLVSHYPRPTLPPCAPVSDTYTPYCAHSYQTPTTPYCAHPTQTSTGPTVHTPLRHLQALLCTPRSDTYRPYCAHPAQTPTGPTVYTPIRHLQALLCTPQSNIYTLYSVYPYPTPAPPTVYTPSDTYTPYCAHSTATRLTVIPHHW